MILGMIILHVLSYFLIFDSIYSLHTNKRCLDVQMVLFRDDIVGDVFGRLFCLELISEKEDQDGNEFKRGK